MLAPKRPQLFTLEETVSVLFGDTKLETSLFFERDNDVDQCRGVISHLIGCTIGLSKSSQPTIKFVGNISRKTKLSGVQVELASWGSLSFNQTIYAEYPAIGFQSVKILSILETTL